MSKKAYTQKKNVSKENLNKSTMTTQKEQTHGSAKKTNNSASNSKELIEKHTIPNTPFTVVRQDTEWFVLMGMYRLTEPLKSKKEACAIAARFNWDNLMKVMRVMMEQFHKEKTQEAKIESIKKTNEHLTQQTVERNFPEQD